jgi:hypothetical protein
MSAAAVRRIDSAFPIAESRVAWSVLLPVLPIIERAVDRSRIRATFQHLFRRAGVVLWAHVALFLLPTALRSALIHAVARLGARDLETHTFPRLEKAEHDREGHAST